MTIQECIRECMKREGIGLHKLTQRMGNRSVSSAQSLLINDCRFSTLQKAFSAMGYEVWIVPKRGGAERIMCIEDK